MIGDLDVAVGRDHKHDARLQGLMVGHGAHRQRAAARQDLAQVAGVRGVEVLGDHDGSGEITRQRRHERGEGVDAARRCPDHHKLVECVRLR